MNMGYGCGLFVQNDKGDYGLDGNGYGDDNRYYPYGDEYGHGCGFMTIVDYFDGCGDGKYLSIIGRQYVY